MKYIKNFFNKDGVRVLKDNPHLKNDAYGNYNIKIGTPDSRVDSSKYIKEAKLTQLELDNIYSGYGLGRRIVDILVDDATRNFIECEQELLEELNRLKIKQKIIDVASFGRLYGGSMLVMFLDDGLDMDKPLNMNSIQRLVSLKIFDRYQIHWNEQDLCRDISNEYFGEPEYFEITNNHFSSVDNNSFRVHRSRCFIFGGSRITNKQRIYNKGWDDSVLQQCYDALRKYGLMTSVCSEILINFVEGIFKVKDLGMKLANQDGREAVLRRLDLIEQSRSVSKCILLDADGEEYEKQASSLGGIETLWDKYSEFVCSVTGIPATKLFGKSPSGLSATGESDLQIYYDTVRAYRSDTIEPVLKQLINILKVQKKWLNKPKNFEWEFASLTTPSENEWAELKKKYADIDAIYIDRGAIDAAETYKSRYDNGTFNINPIINTLDKEDLSEDDYLELDEEKTKEKSQDKRLEKVLDEIYNKACNLS